MNENRRVLDGVLLAALIVAAVFVVTMVKCS